MNKNIYIIAEIGINHNGSIDNCIRMIDASVEAGCNAVKLQFFKAKDLYPLSAGRLDWKDAEKEYSYDIYEAVESFELPELWIDEIVRYCNDRNIDLISSVFDCNGFDFLISKGVKHIKLASYVVTNIHLIEHCAKSGLPLFLSTGGATLGETEDAVNTILRHHNKLAILHCSIQYPTPLKDCNLGVIETLKYAFPEIPIGYSDHTMEVSAAPVQAVYLGAKVIEKHITLDKNMQGPDHFFALTPEELKQMVRDIRCAEDDYRNGKVHIDKLIYGESRKMTYPHEQYLRDFCYMKLYANREIKQGETIKVSDVSVLRPGKKKHGLDPKYIRLFEDYKVAAKKDIPFEGAITWDTIL